MAPQSSLLIVDDNPDFLSTCELFLVECGFRVLKALSGARAVDLSADHREPVSLAIVDLNMPELDGPATIAALKQQRPRLKIMVTSGAMLVPYFARLNQLGVLHFLPKPFRLDELLDSVKQAMA
jgi:DNA-binding NtrC family response regulator